MRTLLLASLLIGSAQVQAYTYDKNVPAEIQQQTEADLAFMASIEGKQSSELHKQIFGEVQGASYKTFFESRVKRIGLNSCGDANAVACVIPFMGSDKIWFSPNYTKFQHPQVARLMIVYHEARHTEVKQGNWAHATCPSPFVDEKGNSKKSIWTGAPLAGKPACDSTPFGSYGSSMILLKNISKFCSSCNEKVQMDAGIYADDQFGRITNANAIKQIKQDLYSR